MWPSKRYSQIYCELSDRLVSAGRQPGRTFGTTVEELEQAADALFVELSRAGTDPDPVIAYRREEAARSLPAAKRIAYETRERQSFFNTREAALDRFLEGATEGSAYTNN